MPSPPVSPMPRQVQLMLCTLVAEPFDDPDWIFEPKLDGLRVLCRFDGKRVTLISRNEKSQDFQFPDIAEALRKSLAKPALLDGEIVCLDEKGQTNFENLLFRRGEPRFYAFDLLSREGEDLRYLPLEERKHKLRATLPQTGERLLYCDHVELAGEEFFWLACQRDVEGIVAKRRFDPYLIDGSVRWYKIRNREYTQWVGREELFERERETDPEFAVWNSCAKVCDIAPHLIDAD